MSLLTAPSVGGRRSPKPSSSISSITITSRKVSRSSSLPDTSKSVQDRDGDPSYMALNNHIVDLDYMNTIYPTLGIPRRKALVVKITEQRVETSKFIQPDAKNGPVYSFPSSRTTGENTHFSSRKSSDLAAPNLSSTENPPLLGSLSATGRHNHIPEISKMIHTESHSQVPSCLAPQMPVVLRRKPTIVKVQEESDTFSRKDEDYRRKVAYRHSFSGLDVTDMKPQFDNEHMPSGAEMQVLNRKTKLYKSTMSLQLTSSNGPRLDDPHTSRGLQPCRPASCYASLFSPVELNSADGSQDASVHSTISLLPHETNIDPACSTTRSSNRCWSTEGRAESREKIYTRTESSASGKGQSRRESALPRNQPLTLIKVPGRKPRSVFR